MQFFALWAIPVFTALGTVVTGFESVLSGKENAELHRKAGEAIRQAGLANERAAESNERSKQLESTNLVLQAKVLELTLKLQPRTFSDDRKQYAKKLLSKYAGTGVQILWNQDDLETDGFAEHLDELLTSLGWRVLMDTGWAMHGTGISIEMKKESDFGPGAALDVFLNGSGFATRSWRHENLITDTNVNILILLGQKGTNITVRQGASSEK